MKNNAHTFKKINNYVQKSATSNSIDPKTIKGWALTDECKCLEPGMMALKYDDEWLVMYYVGYADYYKAWKKQHNVFQDFVYPLEEVRPLPMPRLGKFVSTEDSPCVKQHAEELYLKYIVPNLTRSKRLRPVSNAKKQWQLPDGKYVTKNTYERYHQIRNWLKEHPDAIRNKSALARDLNMPYHTLHHIIGKFGIDK